jgi:phosphate-selective porin OprO/OprP
MKIRLYTILFFSAALLSINVYGQEDEKVEMPEEEQETEILVDNTSFMRLKKHYELGDGLTFFLPGGRIDFTQTLQVLYGVNTSDNYTTTNSQYRIRRARLNFSGTLFEDKMYFRIRLNLANSFQSATTGTRAYNSVLQDAYIEYRPATNHRINFGVRADYADTREARVEGEELAFIERSAVSNSFDPIFDYGIRYKGKFLLGGSHILHPYVSITTGDGTAALQKNYGGFKYGMRLDFLPFGEFSGRGEYYFDDLAFEARPKLVMGVITSFNKGTTSAKGSNGGRYIYGDINQKVLLPDYLKTGFDFLFKYKGFYAFGDWVLTRTTVPAGIAGEFKLSGEFTSYTGQTREQIEAKVLSRLNIGSGYNIQAGYLIHNWALGGRYAYLTNDSLSAAFANQDRFYSFVATRYFLGHNLKIQSEFGFEENKEELKTENAKGNLYAQIMFTVQF